MPIFPEKFSGKVFGKVFGQIAAGQQLTGVEIDESRKRVLGQKKDKRRRIPRGTASRGAKRAYGFLIQHQFMM